MMCGANLVCCVVDEMTRRVRQNTPKVTFLTDMLAADHSTLDEHFQLIYCPDTTQQACKRMILEDVVTIKCAMVVIWLDNSQVPFPENLRMSGQFKKLLIAMLEKYGKKVQKVIILTILPRPDKETELEEEVKSVNHGIYKAVRELKKHYPIAKNVGVMPIHRLFLEQFEYFDFQKGCTSLHLWVVKPVTKYYRSCKKQLNMNGLFHLRSYMLQELGILSGVNTWEGVPVRSEPKDVQQGKRQVWLLAQKSKMQDQEERQESDTDLEDEYFVSVVLDSMSEGTSSGCGGRRTQEQLDQDAAPLPVYVQGRRIVQGDVRLVQDEFNE